ncbi:HAD family hydrolase [Actinoplanes sp. NPDC000266]
MTTGVVFFDVDGTLVPGISSGQHLANRLGHAEQCRQAEVGYDSGLLTNQQASIIDARGWAGWTPADVRGFLDDLPLVAGIPETIAWCRANDLLPVLATLAWEPVGAYLCERFGFARTCGPRLEIIEGRFSGEVAEHTDEYGKRDYAVRVAAHVRAEGGDLRTVLPHVSAWRGASGSLAG